MSPNCATFIGNSTSGSNIREKVIFVYDIWQLAETA